MTNSVNIFENTGPPSELRKILGSTILPPSRLVNLSALIDRDIPRTFFLRNDNLDEEIRTKLDYYKKETGNYLQGDLTGRNIVSVTLDEVRRQKIQADNDSTALLYEQKLKNLQKESLDFCYLNKNNQLCGLSFHFNSENKSWALTITTNLDTEEDQNKKQTLFLSNYSELPQPPNETLDQSTEVLTRIKQEINNDAAFQRIQPLIDSNNALNTKAADKITTAAQCNEDEAEVEAYRTIAFDFQRRSIQRKAKDVFKKASATSITVASSSGAVVGATVKSASAALLAHHGLFSLPGALIGAKSACVAGLALGISTGLAGLAVIALMITVWYIAQKYSASRKLSQHNLKKGPGLPSDTCQII